MVSSWFFWILFSQLTGPNGTQALFLPMTFFAGLNSYSNRNYSSPFLGLSTSDTYMDPTYQNLLLQSLPHHVLIKIKCFLKHMRKEKRRWWSKGTNTNQEDLQEIMKAFWKLTQFAVSLKLLTKETIVQAIYVASISVGSNTYHTYQAGNIEQII